MKIRDLLTEKWSRKYKKSINCSHPRGFSQKAHCSARKKRQRGEPTKSKSINEVLGSGYDLPGKWQGNPAVKTVTLQDGRALSIEIRYDGESQYALFNFYVDNSQKMTGGGDQYVIMATVVKALADFIKKRRPMVISWTANTADSGRVKLYDRLIPWMQKKGLIKGYEDLTNEPDFWPDDLDEFIDAKQEVAGKVYVLARHAYFGFEESAEQHDSLDESLRDWFKEKWVRFGPDGKIRGECARGSDSEGKPKCLPQKKAWALGKKNRAKAASRKRRQDPNPERKGRAHNVATKESAIVRLDEGVQENRDINLLANAAAKWVIKNKLKLVPNISVEFLGLAKQSGIFDHLGPTVQDLLQRHESQIQPLTLVADDYTKSRSMASFTRDLNEITLYLNNIPQGQIASSLAHELQHALDHARSEGKIFNKYMSPSQSVSQYLAHPSEINARLSQVFLELADMKLDQSNFSRQLARLLDRHNLSPRNQFAIDDKIYRKLLTKGYKFYTNSQKLKEANPWSIAWAKIRYRAKQLADILLGTNLVETDELDDQHHDLPSVAHAKAQMPQLLKKVQQVYDDWDEQDRDTYAGGGICHIIADAICDVLSQAGIECTPVSCSHEQHVYVAAKFEQGIYTIDIPYHVYETGGGFSWKKIPDVVFEPADVVWYRVSGDPDEWHNYVEVYEDQVSEKKDACYHKVRSRYKVWPSAYASGALVQCRKKGAKNWGNKGS